MRLPQGLWRTDLERPAIAPSAAAGARLGQHAWQKQRDLAVELRYAADPVGRSVDFG